MRTTAKRLVSTAIVSCVAVCSAHYVAAQRHTPVTVTRLFTGSDGQTHAEEVDLKLNPSSVLDGGERSERIKVTALQIIRFPPGHMNDWHTAASTPLGRQYVITISGRGEVEVAGGQKVLLEPGRILLGDDTTGKGHITRTFGSEDWVSVHVSIADQ